MFENMIILEMQVVPLYYWPDKIDMLYRINNTDKYITMSKFRQYVTMVDMYWIYTAKEYIYEIWNRV